MVKGRHGGRANDFANDAVPERTVSWSTIRYGVWQGLEVGKVYLINGRKGKILEKKDCSRGTGGLPLIKVEWRDER